MKCDTTTQPDFALFRDDPDTFDEYTFDVRDAETMVGLPSGAANGLNIRSIRNSAHGYLMQMMSSSDNGPTRDGVVGTAVFSTSNWRSRESVTVVEYSSPNKFLFVMDCYCWEVVHRLLRHT